MIWGPQLSLIHQFQSHLHLAGSVGVRGLHEICRLLVMSREVVDSSMLVDLEKLSRSVGEAVVTDDDTLVIAVEQVLLR